MKKGDSFIRIEEAERAGAGVVIALKERLHFPSLNLLVKPVVLELETELRAVLFVLACMRYRACMHACMGYCACVAMRACVLGLLMCGLRVCMR